MRGIKEQKVKEIKQTISSMSNDKTARKEKWI
jgi:hypothetical protein